jgi:hypothetical protein
VEVKFHALLTSAVVEDQRSASRSGHFTPDERDSSTHWIETISFLGIFFILWIDALFSFGIHHNSFFQLANISSKLLYKSVFKPG